MATYILQVRDQQERELGFIQDGVLNLSPSKIRSHRIQVKNKTELDKQLQVFQNKLDTVLDPDHVMDWQHDLAMEVYSRNYFPFRPGELHIEPIPADTY